MNENRSGMTPLEQALRALVAEKGRDAYRNTTEVAQYLRARQISPTQIHHVELILTDSAILRYLDQMDGGLSAVECNNILLSAEGSGLSDRTIRVTVEALLGGMGVPQVLEHIDAGIKTRGKERSLYVPPREYDWFLSQIEEKLAANEVLNKDEYSLLDQFVQAGVPKAFRLLGHAYILFPENKKAVRTGVEKLEFAASRGDVEAAALLADYYAERNGRRAHSLYTKPGALAMDDERKQNFMTLKQKQKGRVLQLLMIAVVYLVIQAALMWLPASPVTGSHETARTVCSWINALGALWLAGRYIQDPYRDLRAETIPMLLALFVYAMILI